MGVSLKSQGCSEKCVLSEMLLHKEKLLCEVWTSKIISKCDPHRTSFGNSPVPVNSTLAKMLGLENRTVSFFFISVHYAKLGVLSSVNQVYNWRFDTFLKSGERM